MVAMQIIGVPGLRWGTGRDSTRLMLPYAHSYESGKASKQASRPLPFGASALSSNVTNNERRLDSTYRPQSNGIRAMVLVRDQATPALPAMSPTVSHAISPTPPYAISIYADPQR